MDIVKLSIKRPTLVFVVFTVLTLGGYLGFKLLSYELLPKFSPPVVTITTVYPGADPAEVESSLTKEIEDIVASTESIDKINSQSMESFSLVQIEFEDGVDIDDLEQKVQRKITGGLSKLPDDAEIPTVQKFDIDDLPIIKLGALTNLRPTDAFDWVENKLKPELSRVEGVAKVSLIGGTEREIQVNVDRKKIDSYGLSLPSVVKAIETANTDIPAGKIKSAGNQTLLRVPGKIRELVTLRELVVAYKNDGTSIRLKDIAEVVDTEKDAETLARANGSNTMMLQISKQSDANAVAVSAEVMKTLTQLKAEKHDIGFDYLILQDSSEFTLDAANGVFEDLIAAIVLVGIIMFVFLQSVRNSFIIMFVVPVSLVITLGAMYMLDYTFNLMSLLGLTLAVGTLVDDAIVVIENIYRHMDMGKSSWKAAYEGTKEVALTIFATTLSLIVVFLPITFTDGLVANLLTQFCMVMAVSVMVSTFVALTIVPCMAARFARIEQFKEGSLAKKLADRFEKMVDISAEWITNILAWSLNHKFVTLAFTGLLFFGSFTLIGMGLIGSNFFVSGDRGEFLIELELPKESTVEQANQVIIRAERLMKEEPVVESIFSTVGTTTSSQEGQNTAYKAELNIKLIDKLNRDITTKVFARKAKAKLQENLVGTKIKPVNISILGMAERAPLEVILMGDNYDELMTTALKVQDSVRSVQGTVEVELSVEDGNPETLIKIDRAHMAEYNLSLAEVGQAVRWAFEGNDDQEFYDNGYEYDINIRLDAFDRKNIEDVSNLKIVNREGTAIYLSQIAEITRGSGPTKLERTDRASSISIKAQGIGRPTGDMGKEIISKVESIDIPSSVSVDYGGDIAQQEEGFGDLGIALLASIILVYLIMVALYDSFAYPLVVLFTIPLAVIGALLALALAKDTLSLFSGLGMIMLIGMVAKNAILVVDFALQLRQEGHPLREALLTATKLRFRPILMTNISMIIGLMPIALATGAASEWKTGLAWSLIGGLSSSMFLSMIIVPIAYELMERLMGLFGKKDENPAEENNLIDTELESV
ncbi:multidrug ABC transporter (plasmid) [Fulvitalea axinellae]|uniref:Multidrug ABC transporter n=1 Tax=Fulvitalea axinellae TaxID=1182444 RepID=A0AAU9DFN4_9BACT|nr:multidrug ABC transporter [Fulvitalea axinellae]